MSSARGFGGTGVVEVGVAADVKIDKEHCTITKDGKTYPLYGKVKIVDSFEDIKVKIVDSFEDERLEPITLCD